MNVRSPQAAAAFMEPFRRHLILSLVARPASIAELAKTSGISISLAHYHVRRLCELGILKIVSVERRPGRPIRKYAARSAAFFIPDVLRHHGMSAPLTRELDASLERQCDAGHGWVAYVDENGAMRMRREPADPITQPRLDAWKILDLDETTAIELAGELERVLQRYERLQNARKPPRRFLVRCALAQRTGDGRFATGA